MICLLDNDIVKKLAVCNLLDEALVVLGAAHDEVYVLPAATYVLLKPVKRPEQAKVRLGEAVFNRLNEFLTRVQKLTVQPSPEELRIFNDTVKIDTGEAVLFSASAHFGEFRLATGDKNSLRAL